MTVELAEQTTTKTRKRNLKHCKILYILNFYNTAYSLYHRLRDHFYMINGSTRKLCSTTKHRKRTADNSGLDGKRFENDHERIVQA